MPVEEEEEAAEVTDVQYAEDSYDSIVAEPIVHAEEDLIPQQHQPQQKHVGGHQGNGQQQRDPQQAAAAGRPRAEQLTQQYLNSLQQGRLSLPVSSSPATIVHQLKPSCSSSSSPSKTAQPISRPATVDTRSSATAAALISRPLSAQLRSCQPRAAAATGHGSTWPPPSAAAATGAGSAVVTAGDVRPSSRSCGQLHSPPKLKCYAPGPGQYSPQADRKGITSFTGTARSFSSSSRYEGSYLDAFARTIHSPGPIYYPNNDTCCSTCSASSNSSRMEWPGSSGSTAGHASGLYSTARAVHSAAGTWSRADVGSREAMLVHRCGCSSPILSSSSNSSTSSKKHSQSDKHQPRNCTQSCALPTDLGDSNAEGGGVGGGLGARLCCPACAAAAWSLPGPGSYDAAVGRDGKGVLLTQSCPAFTVPKAIRMASGRHTPFVSASHALHENQGRCSPGPAYNPDISCSRPTSSSPTMQGRGLNHWELLCSSGRASSARQVLGPSPISRTSKHLLGDGPRTHFGSASLDCWPYISPHHSAVLNKFKAGAEAKYNARYSQLDAHVPTARLVSGPEDRFDDKWLTGSGRLQ